MKTIGIKTSTWKRIKKKQAEAIEQEGVGFTADDVITMWADAYDDLFRKDKHE